MTYVYKFLISYQQYRDVSLIALDNTTTYLECSGGDGVVSGCTINDSVSLIC